MILAGILELELLCDGLRVNTIMKSLTIDNSWALVTLEYNRLQNVGRKLDSVTL